MAANVQLVVIRVCTPHSPVLAGGEEAWASLGTSFERWTLELWAGWRITMASLSQRGPSAQPNFASSARRHFSYSTLLVNADSMKLAIATDAAAASASAAVQ